ncbi:MAG: hypothetical protein IH941_07710 [Acidobacteria bacterium]|nr:hypothetical protein [Acidobacteriota bacterium]
MTAETLLIVVLRLLLPLTILRWPLVGGILALVADALDIVLASLVDLGGLSNYHQLDKYLDTYYLGLEAIVAQRWLALPRWTATLLFGYRLIGVVLFEATNIRLFLFVFPALFENFFLFYAVLLQFFPDYDLTPRRLAFWLAILLVPKMVQEYVLHYQQWLDDVVAVDVIEDVARTILGWFGLARIGPIFHWPPNLRL